jgi:hypothetical protein
VWVRRWVDVSKIHLKDILANAKRFIFYPKYVKNIFTIKQDERVSHFSVKIDNSNLGLTIA